MNKFNFETAEIVHPPGQSPKEQMPEHGYGKLGYGPLDNMDEDYELESKKVEYMKDLFQDLHY